VVVRTRHNVKLYVQYSACRVAVKYSDGCIRFAVTSDRLDQICIDTDVTLEVHFVPNRELSNVGQLISHFHRHNPCLLRESDEA